MENQQRDQFLHAMSDRLAALERAVSRDWYRTDTGKRVCRKILATALNGEYADKTEYLANAFLNAHTVAEEATLLKFVEILRGISKPALVVLAAQEQLVRSSSPIGSSQIHVRNLVGHTRLPARTVESCVRELYSIGVFSSVLRMEIDGSSGSYLPEGTPAYTPFSQKFLDFVKDPDGTAAS
jgi:hypothetical protein